MMYGADSYGGSSYGSTNTGGTIGTVTITAVLLAWGWAVQGAANKGSSIFCVGPTPKTFKSCTTDPFTYSICNTDNQRICDPE